MSTNLIAMHRNPLPHEHDHKLIKAAPVARIQCSCGFDGFAIGGEVFDEEKLGLIECPMEEVHQQAFEMETTGAVQKATDSIPKELVDKLIAQKVNEATAGLQAQLSELLAAVKAQLPAPVQTTKSVTEVSENDKDGKS